MVVRLVKGLYRIFKRACHCVYALIYQLGLDYYHGNLIKEVQGVYETNKLKSMNLRKRNNILIILLRFQ